MHKKHSKLAFIALSLLIAGGMTVTYENGIWGGPMHASAVNCYDFSSQWGDGGDMTGCLATPGCTWEPDVEHTCEDITDEGECGGNLGCSWEEGACSGTHDQSLCTGFACGNGAVDPGEVCDVPDFDDATCMTEGFDEGELGCNETCTAFVTDDCDYLCGDGEVDPGEECDQDDFNGETCESRGHDGGTLFCDVACVFDESMCTDNVCGDGDLGDDEECDDGDTNDNDGCSSTCVNEFCGDSIENWNDDVLAVDECDDGNTDPGDGCNEYCQNEYCGDNLVNDIVEDCDDGNGDPNDGCSAACLIEEGYSCIGAPSVCIAICGDGIGRGDENCDDGNVEAGDGCSDTCVEEVGWSCDGEPSICEEDSVCGNGAVEGPEDCDDGGTANGDGCDSSCGVESGWSCDGLSPTMCTEDASCGNGALEEGEECDDVNTTAGDGCNSACAVEPDYLCQGSPSVCQDVTFCGDTSCGAHYTWGEKDYYLYGASDAVTWDEANENCLDIGAELAAINSLEEESQIEMFLDGIEDVWLGANDYDSEGTFKWVTLETFGYTNWHAGQPDNANAGEDCLDINDHDLTANKWNDADCGRQLNYLCELAVCGDGVISADESCDDENTSNGDGCSSTCVQEPGWECDEEPSICEDVPLCGDSIIEEGGEECDDGNTSNGDGCSSFCFAEDGAIAFSGYWDEEVNGDSAHHMDVVNGSFPADGFFTLHRIDNFGDDRLSELEEVAAGWTAIISAGDEDRAKVLITSTESNAGAGIIFHYTLVAESFTPHIGSEVLVQFFTDAICGDGDITADEECDDGNLTDGDGCSAECVASWVCPTDFEYATTVDNFDFSSGTYYISSDCEISPHHGEQVGGHRVSVTINGVDFGEYIEADGTFSGHADFYSSGTTCAIHTINADGIDNSALLAATITGTDDEIQVFDLDMTCGVCGDGDVNAGEECDDDNMSNGDGCSSACTQEDGWSCEDEPSECTEDDVCGNGSLDAGEVCDDGNVAGGDGCSADCTSDESCGNNLLDADAGEECDDGDIFVGDGCNNSCLLEVCGNNVLDFGEECDDNNLTNGDGCTDACITEECGDGVVNNDGAEECDDHNLVNGDGCSSICLIEEDDEAVVCGDGVRADSEACDDGNTNAGDGCNAACTAVTDGYSCTNAEPNICTQNDVTPVPESSGGGRGSSGQDGAVGRARQISNVLSDQSRDSTPLQQSVSDRREERMSRNSDAMSVDPARVERLKKTVIERRAERFMEKVSTAPAETRALLERTIARLQARKTEETAHTAAPERPRGFIHRIEPNDRVRQR